MKNFDDAPFLVIWELTQACDLACVHCRACAIESRNPFELKTEEGFRLLEEVRSFGDPLMVFTGGDPLKRPDLFQLLEKSVTLGLRTTVTPSATPLLTESAIERFQAVGVARMAISLDGPDAASHDGFRRVEGSFERTILALNHAQSTGLQTQINTTVTRHNVDRLGEIARVVEQSGAKLWSVFFLVATGRASVSQDLTPQEYEDVFGFLYDLSKKVPFDIKTTEAQHYRRYVAQRRKAEGAIANSSRQPAPEVIQRQAGINDGKGFVFVSHTGEIFPSGFLPLAAGNVR
ncbi:MAG TPA: radical SAM protein, partial [Acidobacteriaceae bacterium]|nr:radical SAM protein [Acidobacteriaceae bacterium]